jgi:putative inorganic carbon (HCO3(-)) transporter
MKAGFMATGVGLLTGMGLAMARDASPKEYAPLVAGLLFVLIVATWKHGEELCLFTFLLMVPLPMHAFLLRLDPLHGGGALGLYVVASDGPLAMLLIFWFFDWSRGLRSKQRSARPALLLLPFLAVGLLSICYAEKPLWAFCEWVRWVKVLVVLLYATYRLRARDIDVALLGVSASVVLEGGISVLQVTFRSNLGLDKLGIFGSGGQEALTQELATGEVFRGSALTGHPNYLASYLILLLPIFGLLALGETRRMYKLCWSATFLVGVAGLGATMSRAAITSFLGACIVAMILAIAYHLASVGRVAWIGATGVILLGSIGLYHQDTIMERIHADWDASWELRSHLNNSAISMAQDNFALGVGLNNYTIAYPAYNPDFAAQLIEMEGMLSVVHNVYLLVWAEVGSLGLAAFVLFLGGAMFIAWRSVGDLDKFGRCVMLGFGCGLLAAMANDLTGLSLWIELDMFTLAFVFGMLPALRERIGSPSLDGR